MEEVAEFLAIVAGSGQPFKATAGPHHAVRQRDTYHGLLNILIGTARAVSGASACEALRCTDARALAAEAAALSEDSSRVVRGVFACYGSVSWRDPVTDLIRLGLLPRTEHRRTPQG